MDDNNNVTSLVEAKESITVSRTKVGMVLSDESEDKTISVREFKTAPAYVEVRAGVTKNQGNYESLRLDVGVKIPCYVEEITEVEKQASEWVDDRMTDKLEK